MLKRTSTVGALTADIRTRILAGDLPGGARLPEREVTEEYGVSRHTLRVALRALEDQGLVRIETHRGATVTALTPDEVRDIYIVRAALEVEGARLALQHGAGRLPPRVHEAVTALTTACADSAQPFSAIVSAHTGVHRAIVAEADSPRLLAAFDRLATEVDLFLVQAMPRWPRERIAADHVALLAALETEGPGAVRSHLAAASEGLIADQVPASEPDGSSPVHAE